MADLNDPSDLLSDLSPLHSRLVLGNGSIQAVCATALARDNLTENILKFQPKHTTKRVIHRPLSFMVYSQAALDEKLGAIR